MYSISEVCRNPHALTGQVEKRRRRSSDRLAAPGFLPGLKNRRPKGHVDFDVLFEETNLASSFLGSQTSRAFCARSIPPQPAFFFDLIEPLAMQRRANRAIHARPANACSLRDIFNAQPITRCR